MSNQTRWALAIGYGIKAILLGSYLIYHMIHHYG
jgi:hypothetical protein